jgi:HEAT repeat protein
MSKYSAELTNMLESECAHSMEPMMKAKNRQDFADLMSILSENENKLPPQAKARALFALGRWGDNKAVAEISKVLTTLDEVGRLSAVDALGRLNSAPALDSILTISKDPSPHVRKVALKALSRFDKPKAQKGMQSMLAEEKEKFVKDYGEKLYARKG